MRGCCRAAVEALYSSFSLQHCLQHFGFFLYSIIYDFTFTIYSIDICILHVDTCSATQIMAESALERRVVRTGSPDSKLERVYVCREGHSR